MPICLPLTVLLRSESQLIIFVNETIPEPELSLGLWLEGNHFFERDDVALTTAVEPQFEDLGHFDKLRIGGFVGVESQSHELLLRNHL